MFRLIQKKAKQQVSVHPRYTVTLSGSQLGVAIYGIVEFLRAHFIARVVVAVLGLMLAIAALAILLGIDLPNIGIRNPPPSGVILVAALVLIWIVTISGTSFALVFPEAEASKELQQAEKQFAESSSPEDAVNVDLKRLNEYYLINQNQAKSSFRWAVLAMCIGLATIVAGIWLFYFRGNQHDFVMTGLSTAAGCVVNVVSVLFINLHSKTQDRSLYYYQQLAAMQKLHLAIRLLDAVQEPHEKKTTRDMVIKELLAMSREGVRGSEGIGSHSSSGSRQRQLNTRAAQSLES